MTVRYLEGLSLVKISASSDFIYRSYYPKTPKLGSIGSLTPKNSGIFWVKSRTTFTQNLKVVDSETMGGWLSYSVCESLCQPLGPAPGGNLGLFWAQEMGFL